MKNAQITIEFVSVIFLGLVFVLIFSTIILSKIDDVQENKIQKDLTQINKIIVSEIEFAKSTLDGYFKEFSIPEKINSVDYEIRTYNKTYISIIYENKDFLFKVSEFEGEIGKLNVISKKNDTIYIQKIK